jgi:chemotaxis protein MotB
MKQAKPKIYLCVFVVLIFLFSGCALVVQKGRHSDLEKIRDLEGELYELSSAKRLLEERLKKEIEAEQVSLDMQERGLVITVLAEVLFDSGKAKLRQESLGILSKVAQILRKNLYEYSVGVEGHTDNVPITHSAWDSNWELSAHRALSVLYYLAEEGVSQDKLSAIGYGEFRPVASNATESGRQLNRRVEIVVLPKQIKKLDLEEKIRSQEPGQIDIEVLK